MALVLTFVALWPLAAVSGDGDAAAWQPGAPLPLPIAAVAALRGEPGTVLAGTALGLHLSRDGGLSWHQVEHPDLADADVVALAASPTAPCVVYAVTALDGLYRSADCGVTWRSPRRGRVTASFAGLATGGGAPLSDGYPRFGRIAIGAAGAIYLGGPTVGQSTDEGATWQARAAGLPAGGGIIALAADPYRPERLYASAFQLSVGGRGPDAAPAAAVYRSRDGGVSWQPSGSGIEGGFRVVSALAPALGGRADALLAGTHGSGMFSSLDGGSSWRPIGDAPAGLVVADLAMLAELPGTVLAAAVDAGVYRSGDGGLTWRRFSEGLPSEVRITRMVLVPGPSSIVAYAVDDRPASAGFRLWRRELGPAVKSADPPLPFRIVLPLLQR